MDMTTGVKVFTGSMVASKCSEPGWILGVMRPHVPLLGAPLASLLLPGQLLPARRRRCSARGGTRRPRGVRCGRRGRAASRRSSWPTPTARSRPAAGAPGRPATAATFAQLNPQSRLSRKSREAVFGGRMRLIDRRREPTAVFTYHI